MTAFASPTKYFQGSLSYDTAMGVPPEEMMPVFHFRKRFGEINWRKLGVIDIDKVARELDFVTLQENISMVAFCNIDAVSDLDPMFAKMFKLSQFTIEYLLHSQEYLQSVIVDHQQNIAQQEAEQAELQERIKELQEEVLKLKAENKRRRKMIEQQQMLIESGASSYYKCPHCEKAFMNASFLQGHMQRKHPDSVNYIGDVIAHSQREQALLSSRLQDLNKDLERERMNFEDKLKKAEEDKAAWAARTRRDMSRWKKEEEGKWRKELESMKQSFVDEIDKLKAQEEDYKKKISSLQQTMDERHSNLGDLQDDFEEEKQRLHTYEDRIKMLEKTNAEKDSQLRRLMDKLNSLRHPPKPVPEEPVVKPRIEKIKREKEIVVVPPESEEEYDAPPLPRPKVPVDFRKGRASLLAQLRPILVKLMEQKLHECGVDPAAPGISSQTLLNKLTVMKTQRQEKARDQPQIFTIRDQLRRRVEEETIYRSQGSPSRKRRGRGGKDTLPKTSQYPSPLGTFQRNGGTFTPTQPQISAKQNKPGRNGHSSSPIRHKGLDKPMVRDDRPMVRDELNTFYQDEEEESAWESELSELAPPTQKEKPHPIPSIQQHSTPKTTAPPQIQPKVPVTARDSWDSDDLTDLLSPETELPSPLPKGPKVQQLGAKIEAQLQSRSAQKPPVGGVDITGSKDRRETKIKNIDSEDEDLTPISSLQESPKPAPRSAPTSKVRQSTTSLSTGTSVWGSNQGKLGTGGKNETGEQESDWDDISDL